MCVRQNLTHDNTPFTRSWPTLTWAYKIAVTYLDSICRRTVNITLAWKKKTNLFTAATINKRNPWIINTDQQESCNQELYVGFRTVDKFVFINAFVLVVATSTTMTSLLWLLKARRVQQNLKEEIPRGHRPRIARGVKKSHICQTSRSILNWKRQCITPPILVPWVGWPVVHASWSVYSNQRLFCTTKNSLSKHGLMLETSVIVVGAMLGRNIAMHCVVGHFLVPNITLASHCQY